MKVLLAIICKNNAAKFSIASLFQVVNFSKLIKYTYS
jgi:hypothetical protein